MGVGKDRSCACLRARARDPGDLAGERKKRVRCIARDPGPDGMPSSWAPGGDGAGKKELSFASSSRARKRVAPILTPGLQGFDPGRCLALVYIALHLGTLVGHPSNVFLPCWRAGRPPRAFGGEKAAFACHTPQVPTGKGLAKRSYAGAPRVRCKGFACRSGWVCWRRRLWPGGREP